MMIKEDFRIANPIKKGGKKFALPKDMMGWVWYKLLDFVGTKVVSDTIDRCNVSMCTTCGK